MSVNAVSNQTTATTSAANNTAKGKNTDQAANNAAKTSEQGASSTAKTESPACVYEKSSHQAVDMKQVSKLLKESNDKTAMFNKLVESIMSKQANKTSLAFSIAADRDLYKIFEDIEVDDATRAQAQQDISEDGYYGVKQTSERLLSFAKAVAGNDPTKVEEMRSAFQKGFKEATNAWGKELPQICQDTYDAVMKGFDDWAGVGQESEE